MKGIAAYLEGAPVGSYCDDPDVKHTKHDTHNVKPTKGFLLSLEAIQETVKTAFQKNLMNENYRIPTYIDRNYVELTDYLEFYILIVMRACRFFYA